MCDTVKSTFLLEAEQIQINCSNEGLSTKCLWVNPFAF